ncbi:transaldolase family protein [Carboxylicivirga sp. A043]|uniref:transaldolase family protein n=1 Tax=Carboxylicivirga litoralis TaxID=2816963 RepID=UPI0021CB5EAB|nr:transaldolase family protein [Carboxylicivirga sp. A043]MCU4154653.1 transaldolase family protein [Carboxylicivirga sp. A043]
MKNPIPNQFIYDVVNQLKINPKQTEANGSWSKMLFSGSHLWMDTGDYEAANRLWTNDFSALTTNNTLLNAEVQKGVYDSFIKQIGAQLNGMTQDEEVAEVAFCLNAIHGLYLAKSFNCKVSVELHTNYAHDAELTYVVGKRLFELCKEHFIIKVPFSPAGLIGARKLHNDGIPVNMTLCFSVRQNVLASMIAKPAYSNVFVGRVGAYFANNGFTSAGDIGERVTAETQKCLRKVNERGYANTKLIAASIRTVEQLNALVGTDVLTIPVKVVEAFNAQTQVAEPKMIAPSDALIKQLNLKHLWQVSDQEREVAVKLSSKVPPSPEVLIELFHKYGCHDVFPELSQSEVVQLEEDGKIPHHNKWSGRIENYKIGIDTLLNMAGLSAFKKDQAALDARIQKYL